MPTITRQQLFTPTDVDDGSPEVLFTVPTTPSNSLLINGRVRFSNHTTGAVSITAWAVPAAGSPSDSNIALPETTIGTNDYLDVDVPQLSAGGTFRAQSDTASSITAQPIDGAYYTP